MKKAPKHLLLVLLGLTLLLAACKTTPTPDPAEEAVAQVYTSVAETLAAKPSQTSTATFAPLATATLISTVPAQPATQAQPTATMLVVTEVPCQDAIYMSDITIPDNTIFAPGETFVKTWQIFNGGSCAWEANYALSFTSGEEMSGVPTTLGTSIPANGQAQVSVSMTAPLTAGSYTSYWQLTDNTGKKFGNAIFVKIVVAEPTITSTPTETPIPTDTPVPTATTVP